MFAHNSGFITVRVIAGDKVVNLFCALLSAAVGIVWGLSTSSPEAELCVWACISATQHQPLLHTDYMLDVQIIRVHSVFLSVAHTHTLTHRVIMDDK